MRRSGLPFCVLTTMALLAAAGSDLAGAAPVLGEYSSNHRRNCDSAYPPVIEDMVFAMRVTAASDDYEGQLNQEFSDERYWPHPRDPYYGAGTREQRRQALRVSRSVNPLQVRCRDRVVGGHGRANTLRHGHGWYFKEKVRLDDDGWGLYESHRRDQFRFRMGTIFHEMTHTHGYKHKRHDHDSYDHSIPQITRHALQDALAAAAGVADTVVPGRPLDCATPPCPEADTMREYRELGYLVFQREDEATPRYLFDPARRGLGAIRYDTRRGELRLEDAQLHGQRYRRGRLVDFADTWVGSASDKVLVAGSLLAGSAGGEFLLEVSDGVVAVGWAPGAPGNFRQLRRSRWGDRMPSANGPAWTLSEADLFVGIADVRLRAPGGRIPLRLDPAKEIVVQGGGGIAFMSVTSSSGPGLEVRASIAPGATLTGGGESWRFAPDGRVLAIGDFLGTGVRGDVLVADGTGLAVIRHSRDSATSSGPIQLFARHRGATLGGWSWDRDTTVVAVGDFDADGADEWVARNSRGIAIFGLTERDSAEPGFERQAQAFWGGLLFGSSGDRLPPFKLSASHQITAGRVLSDQRSYLIFAGDQGLTLAWLNEGLLRTGDGARILRVSSADSHRVEAVADLDGDSFDEIFISGHRSSRIIERISGRLRIESRSARESNCSPDSESCHGSLWGQWMVRGSDEVVGAMPDGRGRHVLLAINRGEP